MTTATGPRAYVMSDFGSVRVPPPRGCGQLHEPNVNAQGHRFIECNVCAPHLVANHYGYAGTPTAVPLTPDEVAERDFSEREAKAANAVLANEAVKRMLQPQTTGADLGAVLAGMTPQQVAAALPPETLKAIAAQAVAVSSLEESEEPRSRQARKPRTAGR